MRFARLRLVGFKSFVEASDFVIEPGLTGIVGPNGCGKSNLVEALRWVMGESSYRNMRGSGMEDVIFSGSATRPARNIAEVTLFLDNRRRKAPAAFNDADELQVSRRIERDRGSVYRINGKEARARDVQLLFADQSTGARSPSMVGQGRIGELIQARPQARRALLEEAAGISGLHSRRHEAELRLRAAEQNLERLEDVVGELQTRIESLRRQARQAIRFRSLSAEIRAAEAILLHLRWSEAKAQEAEHQSALSQATQRVAQEAALQMEAARNQAVGAHGLPELRRAEAEAASELHQLGAARDRIDQEADRHRQRQQELQRHLAQIEADLAREKAMLEENAAFAKRLDEEEAALQAARQADAGRETEARDRETAATATLMASEAQLQQLTAERAAAMAERAAAERRAGEAGERQARLAAQVQQAEQELSRLAASVADLPDPAAKAAAVSDLEALVREAEAELESAERDVARRREMQDAARAPLQDARARLARVETEARMLTSLLGGDRGSRAPAALDQIRVEKGYETALGAALGDDLDAPLDPHAPAHWAGAAIREDDPALPPGVAPLADHVAAPEALARRLSQIGIVEADAGPALARQLAPGQCLVSPGGNLWRWDGFVASADAPTAAAQRLAQRNRLIEIEAELIEAAEQVKCQEAQLAGAERALQEALETERARRTLLRERNGRLGTARAEHAEAEKSSARYLARQAALAESRARIAEAVAEAELELTQARAALAALRDLSELEARHGAASEQAQADRAALAEAKAELAAILHAAASRAKRLEAIAEERRLWADRGTDAGRQIEALATRREDVVAELARLAEAPAELEAQRRTILSRIVEAERIRRESADRLAAAELAQKGLDEAAAAAIQALSQAREARARAEERLTAAEDRRMEVEARIREVLGVAPHEALQLGGLAPDAAVPAPEAVERRLERLKIERERLGAVNLRAEAEQSELSARLESLVREREDVVEAIRKLRHAIASLNREGRERLLAAFDEVNGHFRELFTHLFGGGMAELQLVEAEDPLQAGLEILARPPGKKPQTMTLLSGGEQALTALALIFAVFLTNPAPICVLDEVDAPLDDHNVERFCNLLDRMVRATETRFIVITHNPITMSRMNRLFGVTMAEQGVSQLVSVSLDEAERLREAV